MKPTTWRADPRQIADPFDERTPLPLSRRFDLLGAGVEFRSDSAGLLELADLAYRDLPAHTLGQLRSTIEQRKLDRGRSGIECENMLHDSAAWSRR